MTAFVLRNIETTDILEFLNDSCPSGVDLSPKDDATARATKKLIELVHSSPVSTNIILLESRDTKEMKAKRQGPFNALISVRQRTLEDLCSQFPGNTFYQARRDTMWGAGSRKLDNFGPLETLLQKTVSEFQVGSKTREWWSNMMERELFKNVYPTLHQFGLQR